MIGSVRGPVLERLSGGEVLVEVGGVGYRVQVPLGALGALALGESVFLYTHLHVREDALMLYGFPTRDERDTFEALLGASGVGPKLALSVLSVHSPSALRRALVEDDLDALTLVAGVGKRTAQRLMIELQARLEAPTIVTEGADGEMASVRSDARAALAELGYGPDEVRDALGRLPDDASVEDLVRDALRLLAPAGVGSR